MPRSKKQAAGAAVTVTIWRASIEALAKDCQKRGGAFSAGVCTVLAHLAANAQSVEQDAFMYMLEQADFGPSFYPGSVRVSAPPLTEE
jgi:hypothetical protein